MTGERELLLRYLNAQRKHVLGILEGLTDEQLRRPVLPSGWTCLGMVKHLALSDEHYWFRCIVGGEPLGFLPDVPGVPDPDWHVEPEATPDDVFDLYRDEIRHADEIIASTPLDMAPRQRDPAWDEWGGDFPDLRFIMLHMITETACHAGHLDAARELLDRRQWIVL